MTVTGSGTVTDSQGQISCPPTCSATYAAGPVTFTANPASGASFTGWGGGCAQRGTEPTCTVNGDFDTNIGAGFSDPSSGGDPPPPPPNPDPPPVDRRNVGTIVIGDRAGIVRHASSNDGVSQINCVYRTAGRKMRRRPQSVAVSPPRSCTARW